MALRNAVPTEAQPQHGAGGRGFQATGADPGLGRGPLWEPKKAPAALLRKLHHCLQFPGLDTPPRSQMRTPDQPDLWPSMTPFPTPQSPIVRPGWGTSVSGTHPCLPWTQAEPRIQGQEAASKRPFPIPRQPILNPEWSCTHACGHRRGSPRSIPLCTPPLHNLSLGQTSGLGAHTGHTALSGRTDLENRFLRPWKQARAIWAQNHRVRGTPDADAAWNQLQEAPSPRPTDCLALWELMTQEKSELGAPKRGARAGSPRGFVDPKQLLRWAGPKSGAGLALGATEKTPNPLLGSSSVTGSETQILSLQSSDEDLQKWVRELQIRKGTSGHTAQ